MKTNRINIGKVDASYFEPLIDLNNLLRNSELSLNEMLLIYIRASQINGCAYCIQSHTKEAVERGEKQYRIHALNAWDHSPFFTQEEEVLLKMTEEITLISQAGLTKATYALAEEKFDSKKITDIIMAVACINAWNRIGISTHLEPFKSQE